MRWLLWICCAGLAFAQGGTEPKPKPEDYELHAPAGAARLGAEFMVHSFSGLGQTFIVKDYLVVEVALYPEKGGAVHADPSAFLVRANGNKHPLSAMPASAVVASIERPQWQSGPRMEGGAGIGGVILGIPGQGGQGQGRPLPAPPRAPEPDRPPGIDAPEQVSPNELLVRTAFPAGDFKGPVSGFVYFPYRGKISALKSLDLLYGDVVLKLR